MNIDDTIFAKLNIDLDGIYYSAMELSNRILYSIDLIYKNESENEALEDSIALFSTVLLGMISNIGRKYPSVADNTIDLLHGILTDASAFNAFIETIKKISKEVNRDE